MVAVATSTVLRGSLRSASTEAARLSSEDENPAA